MPKTKTTQPDSLCQECGTHLLSLPINKGKKQFSVSTWYQGKCDYCLKEKTITEARDFQYPKLPPIDNNLQCSPSVSPQIKEVLSQVVEATNKAIAKTMEERPELFELEEEIPRCYTASNLLIAALREIESELSRIYWNYRQEELSSPFGNSGNTFKCPVFEVAAYSWDDDDDQPYNFKWQDVEITWYKYLGRDTYTRTKLTPDRINHLLEDCLKYLHHYEATIEDKRFKVGKEKEAKQLEKKFLEMFRF